MFCNCFSTVSRFFLILVILFEKVRYLLDRYSRLAHSSVSRLTSLNGNYAITSQLSTKICSFLVRLKYKSFSFVEIAGMPLENGKSEKHLQVYFVTQTDDPDEEKISQEMKSAFSVSWIIIYEYCGIKLFLMRDFYFRMLLP